MGLPLRLAADSTVSFTFSSWGELLVESYITTHTARQTERPWPEYLMFPGDKYYLHISALYRHLYWWRVPVLWRPQIALVRCLTSAELEPGVGLYRGMRIDKAGGKVLVGSVCSTVGKCSVQSPVVVHHRTHGTLV